MPFRFPAMKPCLSYGNGDRYSNSRRRPCIGPHWDACNGIRLPELTWGCVSFFVTGHLNRNLRRSLTEKKDQEFMLKWMKEMEK